MTGVQTCALPICYSLPTVVQAFSQKFPKVRLSLLQGNPKQVADMVLNDQADLAIATEAIADIDGLVSLPCFQWEHMVVVPPSHPLAQSKSLTLEELEAGYIGGTVETYRDETIRGDVVRVRHDTDERIIYTELGHLLTSIAS